MKSSTLRVGRKAQHWLGSAPEIKTVKHCLFQFSWLMLVLLTGCDTTNHTRYQIHGGAQIADARATVAPDDREAIKEILRAAAARWKLKDVTELSLVPNTIIYFQEAEAPYAKKLFAWAAGDQIFVDMMQTPSQVGEDSAYRSTREYLLSELKARFGKR